MAERRESSIGRILHRIEDHIEEWRKQDAAYKAEAEANREKLWAEAMEREKALAATIGEEEARHADAEEIMKEQRVVFVLHSDEAAETLKQFAADKDRLVDVVPGREAHSGGLKGSWLVFECPE